MPARIRWAAPALSDIRELRDYVALDDPAAARRLAIAIRRRVEALPDHPHIGRVVPELPGRGWREVIVPPCRIVYAVSEPGSTIVVLRVRHGRRDLTTQR